MSDSAKTSLSRRGFMGATATGAALMGGTGARMGLHQDKDERDFSQPIVSVSLGLPAVFLWGGPRRADRALRVPLAHGDVVVFGGDARLHFHGVAPVAAGEHPLTGAARINLTFRRAG